jgi:hypothetical protein
MQMNSCSVFMGPSLQQGYGHMATTPLVKGFLSLTREYRDFIRFMLHMPGNQACCYSIKLELRTLILYGLNPVDNAGRPCFQKSAVFFQAGSDSEPIETPGQSSKSRWPWWDHRSQEPEAVVSDESVPLHLYQPPPAPVRSSPFYDDAIDLKTRLMYSFKIEDQTACDIKITQKTAKNMFF